MKVRVCIAVPAQSFILMLIVGLIGIPATTVRHPTTGGTEMIAGVMSIVATKPIDGTSATPISVTIVGPPNGNPATAAVLKFDGLDGCR